ncbi:MAG TPA: AraC family transcriptional regulator [Solirubrobacteraceae bacterium]|nr:AraC family transcriptional regulator [Solirubrobacteraceae bacterium]
MLDVDGTGRRSASSGPFRSTDVDEARDAIATVFCEHELDIVGRRDRFDAAVAAWDLGTFKIGCLRHGVEVVIRPRKFCSYYAIQVPLKGAAITRQGHGTAESAPGIATVLSPTQEVVMRWSADHDQITFCVDRDAIDQELARMLGHEADAPVIFDVAMDLTSRDGKALAATLRCVLDEIRGGGESLDHPLVRSRMEQLIVDRLLVGQRHNFSEQLATGYPAARPPAVRHALEIIRARAAEPLTIPMIAELVGVSISSLQKGFHQHIGVTPQHYLREVRLEHARDDLLAGSRDDTSVNTIAYRWGFTHLARFAGYYKHRYGELPSETLQR